jgi:hypothetical protein
MIVKKLLGLRAVNKKKKKKVFYGLLEFFKHINNDDLNFPC